MIYVIGVDPGEVICGWALVAAGLGTDIRILSHGQTGQYKRGSQLAVPTTGLDVRQILVRVGKQLDGSWPPTLAVEELFIPDAPRHGKQRAAAIKAFKSQAGAYRWVGVAEAYGCPVYRYHPGAIGVPPAMWREAQWGRRRWKSAEAKEYALRMAKILWGLDLPASKHHTAEACFIGAYVATQLRMQRRLERQKVRKINDDKP